MSTDEYKQSNQLISETSPYLLQHAYNPVDWHPWGDNALNQAKEKDKPIIVSIGYSSCHWCHVMEKESFENPEIGKLMSEYFICIKVDREERPDVDQIYMDAVQSMGIQGGWPLNVFLMPDQKPFYGGTYYPPAQWVKMLHNVHKTFEEQRPKLQESADQFAKNLSYSEVERYGMLKDTQSVKDDFKENLSEIYTNFSAKYDSVWGGLNKAPKFPMPTNWHFLLHFYHLTKDKSALAHLELTLDKIAQGGIYDQVGGGFARYSVDERWFAPHFEKMTYDNGQLLSLYANAYSLMPKELYKQAITQTIGYVIREMTSSEGGFYSALDADSEGEEGKYYIWTFEEFSQLLGDTSTMMADYYNVHQDGNWEKNYNILHRDGDAADFVTKYEIDPADFSEMLEEAKLKLLEVRESRERPGLDDKIITSWNALMLRGLVDSYAVLKDKSILDIAIRNATFISEKLTKKDTGHLSLWRTYKDGHASINAYLEDYAFVIDAFLALYQATFDEGWLTKALSFTEHTVESFYDADDGFFFYTDASSKLIARKKELFDNVIPSSNAIMARNLYYLSLIYSNQKYEDMALQMMKRIQKLLDSEPTYLSNWASLYTLINQPTAEVAIVGQEANKIGTELLSSYHPNRILLGTSKDSTLPLLKDRTAIDGLTTIYVCFDKTCQLPVHTVEEATSLINSRVQ